MAAVIASVIAPVRIQAVAAAARPSARLAVRSLIPVADSPTVVAQEEVGRPKAVA